MSVDQNSSPLDATDYKVSYTPAANFLGTNILVIQ